MPASAILASDWATQEGLEGRDVADPLLEELEFDLVSRAAVSGWSGCAASYGL